MRQAGLPDDTRGRLRSKYEESARLWAPRWTRFSPDQLLGVRHDKIRPPVSARAVGSPKSWLWCLVLLEIHRCRGSQRADLVADGVTLVRKLFGVVGGSKEGEVSRRSIPL